MDNLSNNIMRLCRACKCQAENMRSLFEETESSGQKTRVHEMLMACASVQVDGNDNLPKHICVPCIQKLENAYTFKRQCESVDQHFREVIRSSKQSNMKDELFMLSTEQDILNNLFNTPTEVTTHDDENKLKSDFVLSEGSLFPEVVMQDQTLKSDFIDLLDNNQMMLTCRICLKIFTTLDGLKCHKRVHTGELFKCKTCNKEYIRLSHLLRHELTHTQKKVHVCKICNTSLSRYDHLKRHLITHLKEKPYSCNSCNRGFSKTEYLLNHIKKCKGTPVFICDICSRAYNRADSLEVHKRLHDIKMPILPTLETLDNISEFFCEIDFDATFPSYPDSEGDSAEDDEFTFGVDVNLIPKEVPENSQNFQVQEGVEIKYENSIESNANVQNLIRHQEENVLLDKSVGCIEDEFLENLKIPNQEHHDQPQEQTTFDDNTGFDEMDKDSDSNYSDPIQVKMETKEKKVRTRSKKQGHTKPSPKRRKRLKKENIDSDPDDGEEGEYTCPTCSKIFKKPSLLEKHIEQCSDESKLPFNQFEEYECDICQKTFGRSDHLVKHKLSKHNIGDKNSADKKFQCTFCLKSFTTEKYRDMHMKGHLGGKKFTCKTCDKSFLSKSHLTEHMKFHNENSKKFLCSECGQRFIRNDYLIIHMRRHRGEKPFKCKYCGKGFPRTTDLTVHERYHTGEKTHLCTICGRGFGRAYNLTVHMRTHTGEKPYQCTYCEAAFAQGNDLKAHIRRHTGERFHCDLCSETFLMGYLLTQHKRSVHGLNIVSNIRRLQPAKSNPDEPPPIMIPLPQPVVPSTILNNQIQAQLAAVSMQQQLAE